MPLGLDHAANTIVGLSVSNGQTTAEVTKSHNGRGRMGKCLFTFGDGCIHDFKLDPIVDRNTFADRFNREDPL